MLARFRWLGLSVLVSLGLAAPSADAQLWKPKKKPAATDTRAKPKASAKTRKSTRAKKRRPTRATTAKARKPPARDDDPEVRTGAMDPDAVDDDPIIVIEDP